MDNILTWCQRDAVYRLFVGQQTELTQCVAVRLQEPRVNPLIITRHPAITGTPQDFADPNAFTETIKQIKQQLRDLRLFDKIADRISKQYVMLVVAGRFHCRSTGDGQFAGTQDAGVVQVTLFHLFRKDEIVPCVSLGYIAQDPG